jgi:multiple sugar transport system ATP-binding protein
MEDAALVSDAPAERRISSTVELTEALGSDVVVHFPIDAPQAITDDVRELAEDVGLEAVEQVEAQAAGGRAVMTARLNPRTRVRVGERLELVVDTHRLHFFDPDTGLAIYGGEEA